jgi:hypothetical protein
MTRPAALPPCFSVVDALSGQFRLHKRSPTLRGSVPLRVAQACVPLLEGNAFGFQLQTRLHIPLVRGALGWSLALSADEEAQHKKQFARARQRLVDASYLRPDDPWLRVLEEETLFGGKARRLGRHPRLRLWTGLLVSPDRGVRLRLFQTGNRRSHGFSVEESSFASPDAWVPLIVDLHLEKAAGRTFVLPGELACLAPLPESVRLDAPPLARRLEVGRAHAAFYAPSYFQKKEAAATRRYRKQIDVRPVATPPEAAVCEVIACGPADFELVPGEHVLFRNQLDFSFRFDGHSVTFDLDEAMLDRRGRALWQRFSTLYGADFVETHKGALLYLSKYFTTHPPGEPHFFVKPWAFTRTPPGWSSLVDGCAGDGYDVMRGVIATDQFHATPAVFSIFRADEDLAVPAGAPLHRLYPLPRSLQHAGFRLETLPE